MKKITTVLAIVFAMLALFACGAEKEDKSEALYTVNGEEIMSTEIEYFKTKYKAQVLNDYLEKYATEYTEDFWSTSFDGKTPAEALEENALEKAAKAKIQLVLMREEEIYEDISYEGLRKKAEAFNKENEGKEGVVGIKSIQMSQFYTYYVDNGIMELKNIFIEGKLKPTDEEIKAEAEKVRNELASFDRSLTEEEIISVAVGRLEETKYDEYIEELYNNAEIEKVENNG